MNFPFTQAEIERRIADKVPHGMRRDLDDQEITYKHGTWMN